MHGIQVHHDGLHLRPVASLRALPRGQLAVGLLVAAGAYGGVPVVLRHHGRLRHPADLYHLRRHGAHLFGILGDDGSAMRADFGQMVFRFIGRVGLCQLMPLMPFLPAAFPAGGLAQRARPKRGLLGYRLLRRRDAGIRAVLLHLLAAKLFQFGFQLLDLLLELRVLTDQAGVGAVQSGHLTLAFRQLGLQLGSLGVQCLQGIHDIGYRGDVVQTHAAKIRLSPHTYKCRTSV